MVDVEKWKDLLGIAARSITKRRMRSWLTMIGIFIGIAAVVALISLGEGLQNAINVEFEELGADKIFIAPAGSLFGAGGVDSLTEEDIDVIRRVRDVDKVGGYMMSTAQIEWEDELWWHMTVGIPPEDEQLEVMSELYAVADGRWFEKGEKSKALVGYDYANHPAFDDPLLVGDKLLINGKEFEVIGSFEKVGNSNDDRAIVLPMESARDILGVDERIDSFVVKVKDGADVDVVAEDVEREMRRDRDLDEGDEDFSVQTFLDLVQGFLTILDIVTTVLVGIAAVSLFVGAIGIMNTMYTSVLERTKEIGIMKAIGAQNKDVLGLFLLESGLLGLAGGIIGILIGAGLSSLAAFLAQNLGGFEYLQAQFPFWLVGGALLFSFVVGVASGVFPARQAARKNPVDSLRYE